MSVLIRLTDKEASALWSLARCAADTHEDAMAVLGDAQSVAAGRRAMQKILAAQRGSSK